MGVYQKKKKEALDASGVCLVDPPTSHSLGTRPSWATILTFVLLCAVLSFCVLFLVDPHAML